MSKPLAFGLNMTKRPGASKPAPPKRKPMFGGDDDSDDDGANKEGKAEEIGEFDDFGALPVSKSTSAKPTKSKNGPPTQPPKLKTKGQLNAMFGDLSSSLTSRKNAEAASQAAEVRKRDALIAEEKKIAREREAEGDEYEGKEKKLLDKDEQRHADVVKSAELNAKNGPQNDDKEEQDKEKTEADVAKEMNEKGASVALNEDGQVVDKRQLLKGGLNVGAKKKESVRREAERPAQAARKEVTGQQIGRKQAMRERQSRMLEEQLEQSMKRSREEEETQREEVERASKSQKTEGDISSAKERYLARKRAAEEEKKKAATGGN
ncbi:Nuclear speckle splicing regulatory protein 1 like protein [Ilyonectria robusta]